MRKLYSIFFILVPILSLKAQLYSLNPNEGIIGGGFGLNWIDGKPHYTFHFFPEVSLGDLGFGLDLNIDFDPNGKIRTENFNDFSDYLSVIRYVRYGKKDDPFYIRVGALDYSTLGHGSIMYLYNNSPSFDTRKIGMELDIDFNAFGFESVYGNFGQAGVFGMRGFVRPFQFTSLANIPIINDFEIGASFASDFNEMAGVDSVSYNYGNNKFNIVNDEGSLSIFGFDIGIPIVKSNLINFELYCDYTKIIDYGSGVAAGAIFGFNLLDLIDSKIKFERRFNGDNYIPSYFNSFYELERFNFDSSSGIVSSKIQSLKNIQSVGDGFYGELFVKVLGWFDIIGSYQRLDDYPKSGILHIYTNIMPEDYPYILKAGYDKVNIEGGSDLFKLDDRSLLYFEYGYKVFPFLVLSLVYNWTFTPIRDSEDNIIEYKTQKRIEPRISFIYPLKFGQ
ncbi:MAG: hypothetical protein JXA68_04405 [Ignavibacteriales bacterium]|nr:hypothetical protein [Ignavibacteriales bacterium]